MIKQQFRNPTPRPLPSSLIFIFLLLLPRVLQAANSDPSGAQEKPLQTELELAKKGSVYALLHLPSGPLTLKIKGLPLKEFRLAEIPSSGEKTFSGSAHRLIKKYPPPPSIEKEIPPPSTSKKEEPISPLLSTETVFVSVGDMPSRYRLYFEDGLIIAIAPATQECACGMIERSLRRVKETAENLSWEAGRLFSDRRLPDLRLRLSEEEAKAFFWSFSEGSMLLIQSEP